MGASSRRAQAIEPNAADLLMPDRTRATRTLHGRDIEDACFENLVPGIQAARTLDAAARGGLGARTFPLAGPGPFPADFAKDDRLSRHGDANRAEAKHGRLGAFSAGRGSTSAKGGGAGIVLSWALCLGLGGLTAAVFWIGTAPVLLRPADALVGASGSPVTAVSAVPADRQSGVEAGYRPTDSLAVAKTDTAKSGFTVPTPRPARIERAGSILMIRAAGG